jgi:hypothetical protein
MFLPKNSSVKEQVYFQKLDFSCNNKIIIVFKFNFFFKYFVSLNHGPKNIKINSKFVNKLL